MVPRTTVFGLKSKSGNVTSRLRYCPPPGYGSLLPEVSPARQLESVSGVTACGAPQ